MHAPAAPNATTTNNPNQRTTEARPNSGSTFRTTRANAASAPASNGVNTANSARLTTMDDPVRIDRLVVRRLITVRPRTTHGMDNTDATMTVNAPENRPPTDRPPATANDPATQAPIRHIRNNQPASLVTVTATRAKESKPQVADTSLTRPITHH